ncbi:MAG: hypothetical protein Q9224_002266 [Gallowayella concinna]
MHERDEYIQRLDLEKGELMNQSTCEASRDPLHSIVPFQSAKGISTSVDTTDTSICVEESESRTTLEGFEEMALIGAAENAQDIAIGFNKFLDPVPEISTEITALISECYAISSALRELSTAKDDPRYHRDFEWIRTNVNIAQESLNYTFHDVHRLFGGLGRTSSISRRTLYYQVWREIDDHFYDESNISLCKRLEYSRLYLVELTCILMDGSAITPPPVRSMADSSSQPSNSNVFMQLHDRIEDLLDKQDARLAPALNNLSLGDTGANRQRSFERRRPQGPFMQAPEPPPPLRGGGRRPGPMSPQSPPAFDQDYYPWAPPVPDVPTSPTTTTTFSTLSSSASSSLGHWLPRVFGQSRPTTPFRQTGEIPFEEGDLRVRLYHRDRDQRARIHCRLSRNGRASKQCCLPLNKISIQRHASTLKLCEVGESRQAKALWACLRFSSYERLVLFYCAFITLRSEDRKTSVGFFDDQEIHGEKSIYAGKIRDDNFEHALRVFRDRDCGGIRLQASVLRGELKRTPVWTAFITTHIESHRWMRKAGPKTVHLMDLQRYVFSTEYNPQLGPQGQHELRFESSRDAKDFMEVIEELADEQLQSHHR